MRKVLCFALALCILQAVLSEGRLIKKLVTGIVGGSEKPDHAIEGERQPGRDNAYQQHSVWSSHDDSAATFYGRNTTHPYKNTSWHIENEDYLTPNRNESSQHKQRPSSGYGGGGTYDRRPTKNQPYERSAFYEDFPAVRANSTQNNRQRIHQYDDNTNGTFNGTTKVTTGNLNTAKNATETPTDSTDIILRSDSITCCYHNVRDEDIENRKMRCNGMACRLERAYQKSSLWICGDIKCTVANVDFSQTDIDDNLMECSMDGRNIITVQDKPVKCGENEKAHNGRCRQVFGK